MSSRICKSVGADCCALLKTTQRGLFSSLRCVMFVVAFDRLVAGVRR
jgi:hypothetical protein